MIWAPRRNIEQGQLVAGAYALAVRMPCERQAVMVGGLPGADKQGAVSRARVDASRYLTVGVGAVLREMAARGMIPPVAGLSPMAAADLAHGEAQFLVKRIALRAVADGRNLLLDISMASLHAVEPWLDILKQTGYTTQGIFAEITVEESVRRTAAEHRRGQEEYHDGRGYGGRYIPPEAIRALAGAAGSPGTWTAAASSASGSAGDRLAGEAGPGTEVASLIASRRAGQLSLDDLALEFRARRWPPVPLAWPPGLQAAASAIDDPEPYCPDPSTTSSSPTTSDSSATPTTRLSPAQQPCSRQAAHREVLAVARAQLRLADPRPSAVQFRRFGLASKETAATGSRL